MPEAFVLDAIRTPIGRYGGALAAHRPDDLAALVVGEVVRRSGVDPERTDEVIFGAANQAGEDNRNVARMAALLRRMRGTGGKRGLATMCVGVGQGSALLVESV